MFKVTVLTSYKKQLKNRFLSSQKSLKAIPSSTHAISELKGSKNRQLGRLVKKNESGDKHSTHKPYLFDNVCKNSAMRFFA